ncbi:MAG: NAD(P)-binding protein, partial [Planctomycetota bacterium]|nr:NAD(P)-binding protein [Planctomycetota bacterium]
EHLGAFRFRGKTEKLFKARAALPWPQVRAALPDASNIELGFVPLNWDQVDIPSLCASCSIDHSVAPVGHTRGGSRAGYERWEAFKGTGLKNYHRARNRAEIDREALAVSRMSAYIHHGHVSPLCIVRDAWSLFKTGFGDGVEKYIDEVWVWRELAHHLCFLYPELLESTEIIPNWAKTTLDVHRDDPRNIKSWEALARGRAGDPLWDAAQRSLLAHGELHNNVRMTWGKAIVGWSDGPRRAQQMLIDLNHRFALDGNNPNSYGGLLWCLGVLDRPFEGVDAPITGSLRPRPLHEHAARMDLEKYSKSMNATSWGRKLRVAVVGGGMAGMAAARTLADHNVEVVVFDKGRGPGGRMSTRRQDDLWFDHGAQYFTAKGKRFERLVESWVHDGVAVQWRGRIGQMNVVGSVVDRLDDRARYVGIPGMNAVVRHLSETLGGRSEVRFGVRVNAARFAGGRWSLTDEQNTSLGMFDAMIVALPAPQAADVLIDSPNLRDRALSVSMRPCWSAMVSFNARVPIDFDGVFINMDSGLDSGALSWVARDSSKPKRPSRETWVLHASPGWSEANIERDNAEVAQRLLRAFFEAFGIPAVPTITLEAHRWRFANTDQQANGGCLFDRERLLAACGDWTHGGRVEGAYLSGVAAAGSLLAEVIQRAREHSQ